MIVIWVSASFTAYLLRYQLKYIRGDVFINNLVAQAGDIIASAISGFLLVWFNPRQILIAAFVLGMIGMLLLTLPMTKPDHN